MSNQTIDGVPRELALRLLLGNGSELARARKELRALLDAPAKAAEPYAHMRIDVDGNPYRCNPNDHGDAFPVYLGPAAQPQGEPVKLVPSIAQIRHRRPERNCPDFGRWHDMPIERYNKNRTSFIDSAGWECETRLLFVPVVKP